MDFLECLFRRFAASEAPLTEFVQELHLATVIEILQSIRQADMTPMLERIYKSEGGSEVLDTLMKYIYKGMAQSSHGSSSKAISPTATGFSQIGGRNLGSDGGGQAMSVLLSWHEKVRIIENAPSMICSDISLTDL